VIGFDINQSRIDELSKGYDRTQEVETENLQSSTQLSFSANINDLVDCNVFIVTVPTPIDRFKNLI
jgi:UDP-N-acetyl-D-galactosamine dehydrogenase